MKRRVNKRIDDDDKFAANVGIALDTQDDAWLARLIGEVIGVIIVVGSAIWDWITELF